MGYVCFTVSVRTALLLFKFWTAISRPSAEDTDAPSGEIEVLCPDLIWACRGIGQGFGSIHIIADFAFRDTDGATSLVTDFLQAA